jgi:hypothetical protein
MSCAEGTLARTGPKEFTPVEKLFEGACLYGARGEEPAVVDQPLQFAVQRCVKVKTAIGEQLVCEREHQLAAPRGGSVAASNSLHCTVCTPEGVTEVTAIRDAGMRRVVMIHAGPAQRYETNGLLSEE